MGEKKLSNTSWALLFGFMLLIDAFQFGVIFIPGADIFFVAMDEVLDVGIAISLAIFFAIVSGNIFNWQKIGTQVVAFLGKEVTGSGLPLWCLEVAAMWGLEKLDERLAKVGVLGKIASGLIHEGVEGEAAEGAILPSVPINASPSTVDNVVDIPKAPDTRKEQLDRAAHDENTADLRDVIPYPSQSKPEQTNTDLLPSQGELGQTNAPNQWDA